MDFSFISGHPSKTFKLDKEIKVVENDLRLGKRIELRYKKPE